MKQSSDTARSESGVTLVELLVVMILLGVVGSVVTTVIVTGLQTSTSISTRTQALHQIEQSLQRVSRELRVADPLYTTSDPLRELAVTIDREGQRQLVRFQVNDAERRLLQFNQPVTESAIAEIGDPLGPGSTSLVTDLDNALPNLATPIAVAEHEPVFTYYDALGQQLHCDLDGDGRPTDVDECFNTLRPTRQVGIRIIKEVPGARRIDAETRVSIRSIRYSEVLP